MQTLYTYSTSEQGLSKEQALDSLHKKLDHTLQLFVGLIYTITEICHYAERDARNRASKHLPSADDLRVNTKISGNLLLEKILEYPSYRQALKTIHPEHFIQEEQIRRLYNELIETTVYKNYILSELRDKKQEKEIVEFIFTDLILPNETFIGQLEEQFVNWDDDAEMIRLLMLNFLKKPQTYPFQQFVSDEKQTYARDLLLAVIEKQETCDALIKPKLINWDPERTALIDMLLIRMGVCELLYFETIPPKVTINEYIDLAKEYSTPQSGHFVNGILDSIHKDLARENKLHKVEFRKQSERNNGNFAKS